VLWGAELNSEIERQMDLERGIVRRKPLEACPGVTADTQGPAVFAVPKEH
jgi:hypothetical protein